MPSTPPAQEPKRSGPRPQPAADLGLGVAIAAEGSGSTITARRAGTLRDLGLEVNPKKVGVRAALQHLVWREADSGDDVRRRKGRLLHFREIIVGIAVQLQNSDFDQRIFGLRPNLREIERIVLMGPGLFFGHHLD